MKDINVNKIIIIISILLSTFPLTTSASIDHNLRYGQSGKDVVELQNFLIKKDFLKTNVPTGSFFHLL